MERASDGDGCTSRYRYAGFRANVGHTVPMPTFEVRVFTSAEGDMLELAGP
jgi:hypothetical protein